jgi:hypothetical protein
MKNWRNVVSMLLTPVEPLIGGKSAHAHGVSDAEGDRIERKRQMPKSY